MKTWIALIPILATLTFSPAWSEPIPLNQVAEAGQGLPELTQEMKVRIGKKIWQSECGGRIDGLTSWNAGEEFPSLGIGHFIWYPKNFDGPFEESFHKLIEFARARGADPPAVALHRHCPWNSKAAFEADLQGPELKALRTWLAHTVTLQTDFIMQRSRAALAKMQETAETEERARLEANYNKVASTTNGVYALIDYVNFKGEGINPKERYGGEGWGLMQVLLEMRDVPAGQPAAREFAAAAKRTLDRRIANSPPDRGESRWRAGWHNRCNGYANPF
ncbi:MAG: hypothetical protein WC423_03860 [Vulcanimicrobiota bacterium]